MSVLGKNVISEIALSFVTTGITMVPWLRETGEFMLCLRNDEIS